MARFDVEGIEGKEYIALLPEEDETVLIYQYKELDDEEFELLTIEDDDEFDTNLHRSAEYSICCIEMRISRACQHLVLLS